MNDIIQSIASPSWWFSVVVVGILASIIAAYLKHFVDRWLNRYSDRRATAVAMRNSARVARIAKYKSSNRNLLIAFRKEHTGLLFAVVLFVAAALLFVVPASHPLLRVFFHFGATVVMILGTMILMLTMRLSVEIDEAIREDRK